MASFNPQVSSREKGTYSVEGGPSAPKAGSQNITKAEQAFATFKDRWAQRSSRSTPSTPAHQAFYAEYDVREERGIEMRTIYSSTE